MKQHWFIKRWFLQGLILILPAIITAVVLYYSIVYADLFVWFIWDLFPWEIAKPNFPGLGLIIVVALIVLVGALAESYIVSYFVNIFNILMSKVPFIRNIYSTVLQVAQSLLGNKKNLAQVVMLEYPRKGVYSIAFKTSDTSELMCKDTGHKMINIFLPTTPNPTSGFYLMVPEQDVTILDIDPEAAFKLIISAGIVND
jgi:uncharacterized membrane protein